MKVSLIIPTYNREEFLIDTLKCALNQNFDQYEIIVVDQSLVHQPNTTLFLEEHKNEFNYIKLDTPSLTKARNIGVKASLGEVIIMIDDDTLFKENFIQEHWDAHQKNIDVVSGRFEEGAKKISKYPIWYNTWGRYSGSENCKTLGQTNKITGGNGSFKRKVFDALGGYDERYIKMANCEDSDFGYRAYLKGYNVMFVPTAEVIHRKAKEGGSGNRNVPLFLDESYYLNRFYFTKKNFPAYAMIYCRFRFTFKALKAAYRMVRSAEKNAKRQLN